MKLIDMRAKVRAELAHIPDWPEPQRELRMLYWNLRMASLGRKRQVEGTALDIVERCIDRLRSDHPDHTFEYDAAYFKSIADDGDRLAARG